MSHVIGIRHDSADEGIPCENGMKVKWYRGRNNVSFVFTTGSLWDGRFFCPKRLEIDLDAVNFKNQNGRISR